MRNILHRLHRDAIMFLSNDSDIEIASKAHQAWRIFMTHTNVKYNKDIFLAELEESLKEMREKRNPKFKTKRSERINKKVLQVGDYTWTYLSI